MVLFHSETDFKINNEKTYAIWISDAISEMKKEVGDINYIFCDDAYLLKINQKYLQHDFYTDIISFDYSKNNTLSGDIFISIERVEDNAKNFGVTYSDELKRVLIHGVLHFAGFNDKTIKEEEEMRKQEDYYLALWHF